MCLKALFSLVSHLDIDVDLFSGEAGGDGGGKSGKKNQKRRAKAKKNTFKDGSGGSSSHEAQFDPVEELRQRLADAKISKVIVLKK